MMKNTKNDEMFEDYPQDFVDKMDDLKGKVFKVKVSMFEQLRFGCDEIESPSGMNSYGYQGEVNGSKKR